MLGMAGTGYPRRVAIENKSAGGPLGSHHGCGQMATTGREVRNAHGRKSLTASQAGQEVFLEELVLTRGNPATRPRALGDDKRRRQTCAAESQVALDHIFFRPALATPLGFEKPLERPKLAAQPKLLGRPRAREIGLPRELRELLAQFSERGVSGGGDRGHREERGEGILYCHSREGGKLVVSQIAI